MKEKQTLLGLAGFKIDDSWQCFMAEFCKKEITQLKKVQRTFIVERLPLDYTLRTHLNTSLKDLAKVTNNIGHLPNNAQSYGLYLYKYEVEQQISAIQTFLSANIVDYPKVIREITAHYLPNLDYSLELLIDSLKSFEKNAEKQFENIIYPPTDN